YRFILFVITFSLCFPRLPFSTLFPYTTLFRSLLILLGMMGGLLFRELTELALRVLDPTEFSIQSGRSIASFSRINLSLLWVALVDRKSTRLNSSHVSISYAVFCLKKKIIKKRM